MAWNLQPDRQIWLQLEEILTRRIVSGQYLPGSRIPSVRDLAAEAGVNPNTMQRALTHLEEQGLLTAQRNTGRFITEDTALVRATREVLAQQELRLFRKKMELLGYKPRELTQLMEEIKEESL